MPRKVSLIVVHKANGQFELYGEHGRCIFKGDRKGIKHFTEHRQTGRVIEATTVDAGLKAMNGQKRHTVQSFNPDRLNDSRPRQGGGVKRLEKVA
jgi:hypothetical protein